MGAIGLLVRSPSAGEIFPICSGTLVAPDVFLTASHCTVFYRQDLALRGLLARMPAGLLQQVGETGWQLSHGERSRLFIARALLQRADFVVLDESFAQLDPENLQRARLRARSGADRHGDCASVELL